LFFVSKVLFAKKQGLYKQINVQNRTSLNCLCVRIICCLQRYFIYRLIALCYRYCCNMFYSINLLNHILRETGDKYIYLNQFCSKVKTLPLLHTYNKCFWPIWPMRTRVIKRILSFSILSKQLHKVRPVYRFRTFICSWAS
jgi:hypothetical protein